MWGRRLALGAAVLALSAGWGSAAAGAATVHSYYVSYSLTGHYAAKTETIVDCGNEFRDEDTHFSLLTQYKLALAFGAHGFAAAKDTGQPSSIPGDDNSSSVSFSGCLGPAACHGLAAPAKDRRAQLSVSAAGPGGRSRFNVGILNGGENPLVPEDFSGSWGAGQPGSCGQWGQSGSLVIEEFNLPAELLANFPVKYSTLRSLPRGHYFKVHISAGHYAQKKVDFCQPSDGCESETFDWSGVVRVQRTS